MLEISNKEFKVKGYYNRWSVIDVYEEWALLENCTYGDETCYLVVRRDTEIKERYYTKTYDGTSVLLPTIFEVVCETYDDINTALEDEGII